MSSKDPKGVTNGRIFSGGKEVDVRVSETLYAQRASKAVAALVGERGVAQAIIIPLSIIRPRHYDEVAPHGVDRRGKMCATLGGSLPMLCFVR